jgi:exonuclease III
MSYTLYVRYWHDLQTVSVGQGDPLMTTLRIATFNLENLSLTRDDDRDPTLAERIGVLQPALERLQADVLCLQEIHGHRDGEADPWKLTALDRLLAGTRYRDYHRAATWKNDDPDQGAARW